MSSASWWQRLAQLRQALRVALTRDDGFDDGHAGHTREITHDLGEFEVHLLQGLVHVLNMVGGRGEQPIGMQTLQPLAVEPIGFRTTGGALGLAGIDEEHLHAPGLQERKQGHPGDPVDAMATVVTPQSMSQSARASRSTVHVPKRRTGCGSHPGGTATQCSASPMSMPAAWGWQTWSASESTDG